MYCLYVGFDYTYIDVNALAQGIKSFLASHVWSQAVAGARTYGTDSPAITSQPCVCMYVCMYVLMYIYMYICMYVCIYVCMYVYICMYVYVYMYVCMYVRLYVCMSVCMYNSALRTTGLRGARRSLNWSALACLHTPSIIFKEDPHFYICYLTARRAKTQSCSAALAYNLRIHFNNRNKDAFAKCLEV